MSSPGLRGGREAGELPDQFREIPLEFRILQKKFDQQKIFTNASNDVRMESLLRSRQFKEERQTELVREAVPQYMSKTDNNIDMFREIERIIDEEATNGMQAKMMKRSLVERKQSDFQMEKSQSADQFKSRKSRQPNRKLPSIKKRYGKSVVSTWQKGPIDMPKDRYFDLNDKSIYGGSTDARGRQLRQQTKLLMNSFQTANKRANINEICRKRRVEEFRDKGEDHVVGVFDDLVAAQQDLERTTKVAIDDTEFHAEVSENVRFRKRKLKRKSSSRVLELWHCLGCPPASRLAFKLQADLPVPDHILEEISSPMNCSSMKNSPTVISKLEHLADCVYAFNALVLILRLWRERKYPDIYTSSGFTQPVIDICRFGGFEKCVKKSRELIPQWLTRLCGELWRILLPQLRFWALFSKKFIDKHFTTFIEELHEEMCAFVAMMEEESMINKDTEDITDDVVSGEQNVEVAIADNISDPTARVIAKTVIFDPDAPLDIEVEKNIMKDRSVVYNTKNLSKKTQQIYENLPPIVDSVNINKVSKNLLKEPNKILNKRLQRARLGQEDDEELND